MREYPSGTDQCAWTADGAPSCAGAAQACSGGGDGGNSGGGSGDPDNGGGSGDPDTGGGGSFDCTESTASNYSHVVSGSATTNGIYAFAVGSGENMGLYNIFYSTTLAQTSEGYFEIGQCP